MCIVKLSIIVPFHRGVHFLEDCFESIRDQGLTDFETILVLDHVKEDVQPVINEYHDINLKVVTLKEKGSLKRKLRKEATEEYYRDCTGVASARNEGLKAASGEYVYFLDSDDYIIAGSLLALLQQTQEQAIDLVYGKRSGTWFRRKVYLAALAEKEAEKERIRAEKEQERLARGEQAEQEGQEEQDDQDDQEDTDDDQGQADQEQDPEDNESNESEDGESSDSEDNENPESEDSLNSESEEKSETDVEQSEDGTAIVKRRRIKLTRRQKKVRKVLRKIMKYKEGQKEFPSQIAEAYYALIVAKKGLKSISVTGVLFRKEFIDTHHLSFNDSYMFFSDAGFMVKALSEVDTCAFVKECVYVKRKHNDPIHFPSLNQTKAEDRFDEYIVAYKEARGYTAEDSALRTYVDNKLIAYFVGIYAPRLRRSNNEIWRTERFKVMQECMKQVDSKRIKSLKGYKKRLVKALIKGNVKKATMVITIQLGKRKLKKIKKNKRIFAYYLYHKVFSKMEMKDNWVLCESFFGKSYSDSPKYIYEYICKNYPDKYKFIWVINDTKTKIPYGAIKVKRFSIRYCYYLARCKYDIFNVRQPEWFRKREGNVFLETWHGTPLKKLVFDQEEVMGASPLYKAQFYKQSRVWDYLVSANHFSSGAFKSAFLFDKEMLEYGYPRNDILHSENKDEIASDIRKKLGIPADKKTILYAPTWRDDEYYGRGEYKFALKLDLRMLKEQLGDEYVVILRTHYFIADALDVTGLEGFAFNCSKYNDISELYLISDILITDYSSVFFDYSNLKRPILFYTYDLDKYRDMLRGFYMDIEKDVPGPLLFTSEEVADAIIHIDDVNKEYADKYETFYERFCSLEDGHAAENIAKRVFELS